MNPSNNQTTCAEVIAIGDEMTSGARVDTNSQWLTQQLSLLGIPTHFHSTVGDDLQRKLSIFEIAASRVDLIIVTGGLGPTADDLTRQVIAELAEVELVLDQPSLDHIKARFQKFGREMPDNNVIQAKFPAGSQVIPNPDGTAPGIDYFLERQRCRIVALPGVPAEMKQMWEATVKPKLADEYAGGNVIMHRTIRCFGQGESATEEMIPELIKRDREPRVGITASGATISLRIVASQPSAEQCQSKIKETESIIRKKLGTLVYGVDDQELQDVVIEKFRDENRKLAIVDCALHGLIARALRMADPDDRVFAGAFQFASTQQATQWLDQFSSSDENALVRLAQFARDRSATGNDKKSRVVGIGIGSKSVEPGGSSTDIIPVVIADGQNTETLDIPLIGHPSIHESRTMKKILNVLRFLDSPPKKD